MAIRGQRLVVNAKVKEAIKMRLTLAKSAPKKYTKILKVLGDAERINGALMYHGAATGRWASRIVNVQNLPRPTIKHADAAVELFRERDLDLLELYGPPMEVLSSGIRSIIKATPGYRLLVADFSQIEARVLPWLAGQEDVIEVFKTGQDLYKHAASQVFGVAIDDVDDEQRFVGKVAMLALGFQGGARAFSLMAKNYGVDIDEEKAETIKRAWRRKNDRIVSYWNRCEDAAKMAIESPGKIFRVGQCDFYVDGQWLLIRLPSGRELAYFKPRLAPGKYGDKIQYMGMNSQTRAYCILDGYGGRTVENITQAVARDCMAEAMLRLDAAGYPIVLTVHDEVIAEVPTSFGSIDEFVSIMCESPPWADGLPIEADGFETVRYRK